MSCLRKLVVTFALALGFVCAVYTNTALAQGTWITVAPMPTAVVFGSGVAFGGEFYVMNGAIGATVLSQVYDPITDSWSSIATDPVTQGEAAVVVVNNKIYVAEGWINSDSNNPTTALEIYDPATDSWTAGASSLVARGLSATAVIGGKIYITGGTTYSTNPPIATLEIYDPNTNTWSIGASIPVAASAVVGVAMNGKFYVVGGGGGGARPASADMYIYDPATDTWTSGAPMPFPRDGAAGGVINGKLYVTGGSQSNGTDNPVVVYDPIADSWSVATAEPTPRAFGAAGVVGNELFVAGGYAQVGGILSTVEAFTPIVSAQVQPPINADGSSVFNASRGVVPVKFTLTVGGVATCDLPSATISLTRTAGGTVGSIDEGVYLTSADSGPNFRISDCQYVYNLGSKSLGTGTYRADISISGDLVGSGVFGLK